MRPRIGFLATGGVAASIVFAGAFLLASAENWTSAAKAGQRSPFVVDQLPLGASVAPRSAAYQEYQCGPSEQFDSFTWCKRRRTEIGKSGEIATVTSILHASDYAAAYISRSIEPALFASGDIDREILRLSERFGLRPHVLQPPHSLRSLHAVIAYWGDVTLKPLDARSLAQLAAGQHVQKGMLFDFLENFGQSAKAGLPVFHLGGGPGYVWGAHFDDSGVGALRTTAIDASQFEGPPALARREDLGPGLGEGRSAAPGPGTASPSPKPEGRFSSGSGFFVSNKGYIVTNNHVIEDCSDIRVFMDKTAAAEGRTVARDTTNDLALLATRLSAPAIAAPRASVRLGESVSAFGYPHADILATSGNFTQGNVTALAGMGDDSRYLQTSAPVQAGNSGGPLLDRSGNLVGIVTAKLNAVKIQNESGDLPQNVNFALKASIVANFLDINGIRYAAGSAAETLKPEDLADQAKAMSVFIVCR